MSILVFILVGFLAEIVDGTLGMAYGVLSTTFMLTIGVPPALASACVHTAEVVTTAVSGTSHLRLGNVDKRLFRALVIPGVIGSAVGAYLLTQVPVAVIKPLVAVYLAAMGGLILYKAFKKRPASPVKSVVPLGLAGGLLDAMGGGGWGPVVTSTLVAAGNSPRFTVGSVNTAEFFVTVASSITFFLTLGLTNATAILGLIIGGAIAAPFGAYLCRKLPTRALMVLVALVIIVLSVRTLALAFA